MLSKQHKQIRTSPKTIDLFIYKKNIRLEYCSIKLIQTSTNIYLGLL